MSNVNRKILVAKRKRKKRCCWNVSVLIFGEKNYFCLIWFNLILNVQKKCNLIIYLIYQFRDIDDNDPSGKLTSTSGQQGPSPKQQAVGIGSQPQRSAIGFQPPQIPSAPRTATQGFRFGVTPPVYRFPAPPLSAQVPGYGVTPQQPAASGFGWNMPKTTPGQLLSQNEG